MNIWSKLLLNILEIIYHSGLNNLSHKRKLFESDSDYINDDYSYGSYDISDLDSISYFISNSSDLIQETDKLESSIVFPPNKNSTDKQLKIIISMTLLQVQVTNESFNFYFLSNDIINENFDLKINITIFYSNPSRILQETKSIRKTITVKKKKNLIKNNHEISYYSTDDEEFTNLISEYEEGKIKRIVVTKIDIIEDKENKQKLYKLDVDIKDNADSDKNQKIDFYSLLVSNEGTNYDIKVLKVVEVSLCADNYKFNLTVDDIIEGSEINLTLSFNINLETLSNGRYSPSFSGPNFSRDISSFNGNNSSSYGGGTNSFGPKADCILSNKYKNIIPCILNRETTQNINFTIVNYFSLDEKKMISISADKDFSFPLYCHEKSPIPALIFISSIFLFIVIVVIIIIILMNKKGRGDRGYEVPNNSNNNMIGISSGNLSK